MFSALEKACESGDLSTIEKAIEEGVDINRPGSEGFTPFK
jgi:hypothetical protein